MEMFDPLLELEFLLCHSLFLALLCHLNSVTVFVKIFKILNILSRDLLLSDLLWGVAVTWAIIGIGRERTRTPAAAIKEPTSFPNPSLNDIINNAYTYILFISLRCTWCGVDVSVANGGHGDDAVVNGSGNWSKAGVISQLYEVTEAAEDEAGDAHQEHKQGQLLIAGTTLVTCIIIS